MPACVGTTTEMHRGLCPSENLRMTLFGAEASISGASEQLGGCGDGWARMTRCSMYIKRPPRCVPPSSFLDCFSCLRSARRKRRISLDGNLQCRGGNSVGYEFPTCYRPRARAPNAGWKAKGEASGLRVCAFISIHFEMIGPASGG